MNDQTLLNDTVEALHWVRTGQLQIARFVENFQDWTEDKTSVLFTAMNADAHFLLIAAAQAEKALARAGRALPDRGPVLRCLRNVHEHWEQHKESFASKRFPKRRAGQMFADLFPDAAPWNLRMDMTGTWISVLRLEDLWEDLLRLEAELENDLAQAAESGLHPPPERRADVTRPFPRRESRLLGITVLTQSVVLDFDGAS